jgi:small GTP-binding protein|tara:strand:- start:6636 stop:7247 length:612 start_codon:yes stop_codon:yes gene_type:complete
MERYDYAFKFILVGESGVGKSSLIERYINKHFVFISDVTIGVEYRCKIIDIDNTKIRIEIWDTAGQERFRSITRGYYRDAIAAFLIYDITQRLSLIRIPTWIDALKENAPSNLLFKVLIGNKIDNDYMRQVSFKEGKNMANSYNIPFYEVSAKSDNKISDIFRDIAKLIKREYDKGNIIQGAKGFKVSIKDLKQTKNESKCCQ